MLRRLKGHHIVVGYGNTGSAVAQQLRTVKGARVVVIETDASLVRDASEDGCVAIHGDAGQDEVLEQAGIANAASLVCAASPDSALMTVFTARLMAPDLNIVARANLPDSASKLLRAGATKVVSVHDIAARRLLDEILGGAGTREMVESAIEVEGRRLPLATGEVVVVVEGGPFTDEVIRESGVLTTARVDVVAVRRHATSEIVDATDDLLLKAGDVLVLVGSPSHVDDAVKALAQAQE